MVAFELFRPQLVAARKRCNRAKDGRPPHDPVLRFKALVLPTLHPPSDDRTKYQIRDRLSFSLFLGLALHDPVPDAKTIWLVRKQPVRVGAFSRPFARYVAALRDQGRLAMGRPRLADRVGRRRERDSQRSTHQH